MLSSGSSGISKKQPAPHEIVHPKATLRAAEEKIIHLAKMIKSLVPPPSESNQNEPTKSGHEEKVNNCFKDIIDIAKKTNGLDGSVLNEVLVACNALRINNPLLASKLTYISQTAKKLVEERTAGTEDLGAATDSSITSSLNSTKLGMLGVKGLTLGAQSTYVTQIPRESSRTNMKLQKLTSDGLPPLKDFKKKGDFADGSQHSVDFGFFDLSVHDRSGMPEWNGVKPPTTCDDPAPKMPKKMQYSVSQLNIADYQ
jgi:hypothetical protein